MKNKFLTAILCLGLLTAYFACEKDDPVFKEEQVTDTSEPLLMPNIKDVSFDTVGETFNRLKNQYQLDGFLHAGLETNTFSRVIDTLGVIIYTDEIKEITIGDYTSYTMRITLPDSDGTKFYNLTMEDKNGVEGMFMTRYTPTQDWLNNKNNTFEGGISSRPIDVITAEFPDNNGGGGSGSTNNYGFYDDNTTYPTDCDGWVNTTIIYEPYNCSCATPPHGPNECNLSTCSSPGGYAPVATFECFPFNFGGNDPGTGNNTGGGGNDESTGPNDSSGNDSFTTIIDEECTGGKIKDENDDCVCPEGKIEDSSGSCVCAEGYVLNDRNQCVIDNCEKLNNLILTDSAGIDLLAIVNSLRTKLSLDKEWSVSFEKKFIDGVYQGVPQEGGIAEGISSTRSKYKYGTRWFGMVHTHPVGGYSIFSWLDLNALKNIYSEVHEDFNKDVFLIAVAPNNVTYALRVDNIQALAIKINDDLNNAIGSNANEKQEKLMKLMKDKYDKSDNQKKAFLELYGNHGISLYEATDANLNNWNKLELDEDDNDSVSETPCN